MDVSHFFFPFLPSSSLSVPTCDHYQSVIYQGTTHGVGDNEDKTGAIEVEGQQEDIRVMTEESSLPPSTSSSRRFFHQENLSGRVSSQEESSREKKNEVSVVLSHHSLFVTSLFCLFVRGFCCILDKLLLQKEIRKTSLPCLCSLSCLPSSSWEERNIFL